MSNISKRALRRASTVLLSTLFMDPNVGPTITQVLTDSGLSPEQINYFKSQCEPPKTAALTPAESVAALIEKATQAYPAPVGGGRTHSKWGQLKKEMPSTRDGSAEEVLKQLQDWKAKADEYASDSGIPMPERLQKRFQKRLAIATAKVAVAKALSGKPEKAEKPAKAEKRK